MAPHSSTLAWKIPWRCLPCWAVARRKQNWGPSAGGEGSRLGSLLPAGPPTCLFAQVLLQRGQLHVVRVAHGGDVLLQPGPGLLLRLVVGPQLGQARLVLLERRAGDGGERSMTASNRGFREASSVPQSRKRS